jgi:sugar (pentulose or hexulose) kinase
MSKRGSQAMVGAGVLGATAGGTSVSVCDSDDKTLYCRMTRWFNMTKMIIGFIMIMVILYILGKEYLPKKLFKK